MGQIGRGVILAVGLAGGTLFSQAPEFAQQYRQRIGGAVDELRIIVDDSRNRLPTIISIASRHSMSMPGPPTISCVIAAFPCAAHWNATSAL
ncbi:hypothetical protein FHT93_004547 [Rhizobium sp. BK379]|jgi:hypothetical protein|nr:hypothetical protein [Rhizobium sp. BK379]